MTTVVEQLRAARARILKGWCKGCYARDMLGDEIPPDSPEAVSWCLFGALVPRPEDKITDADRALIRASGGNELLGDWNDEDERTIEEVIGLYDKAIALAEAEGEPGAAAS